MGRKKACCRPIWSAITPCSCGITAPPTMAMISRLEALLVIGPRRSMPSEKMVGNMIELNRPIAMMLYIAVVPALSMVVSTSKALIAANVANSLRGEIFAISAEPTKRPIIAPPQYHDTYLAACCSLMWPISGIADAAIQRVVEKYGDIDVLFNVAGTIIVKAFHDTSLDEFDLLFDVNVRSAFIVCRNVVLRMMQTGGGSIVIMSSISGHLGFAYEGVYNMTKAANLMLAKSIAAEYREFNIRANAVCLGFVDTAHGQREIAEFRQLGQNWDESALADNQGRICDPREVARAALFLASDDASFINGTGLLVDNGWHAIG